MKLWIRKGDFQTLLQENYAVVVAYLSKMYLKLEKKQLKRKQLSSMN